MSKYAYHLPLYRIDKRLERLGLVLPRKTQGDWLLKVHILAIMNTDPGDREHLSRPRIGLRAFLPQVFTISQFRQVFS